jgi:hypothetical protein
MSGRPAPSVLFTDSGIALSVCALRCVVLACNSVTYDVGADALHPRDALLLPLPYRASRAHRCLCTPCWSWSPREVCDGDAKIFSEATVRCKTSRAWCLVWCHPVWCRHGWVFVGVGVAGTACMHIRCLKGHIETEQQRRAGGVEAFLKNDMQRAISTSALS